MATIYDLDKLTLENAQLRAEVERLQEKILLDEQRAAVLYSNLKRVSPEKAAYVANHFRRIAELRNIELAELF